MRKFKCYECLHIFEIPHGEGGRGVDLVCPQCGSQNVHRIKNDSLSGMVNWGRGSRSSRRGRSGQSRAWRFRSEDAPNVVEQKNADES
jgi:rubredoxin